MDFLTLSRCFLTFLVVDSSAHVTARVYLLLKISLTLLATHFFYFLASLFYWFIGKVFDVFVSDVLPDFTCAFATGNL